MYIVRVTNSLYWEGKIDGDSLVRDQSRAEKVNPVTAAAIKAYLERSGLGEISIEPIRDHIVSIQTSQYLPLYVISCDAVELHKCTFGPSKNDALRMTESRAGDVAFKWEDDGGKVCKAPTI